MLIFICNLSEFNFDIYLSTSSSLSSFTTNCKIKTKMAWGPVNTQKHKVGKVDQGGKKV